MSSPSLLIVTDFNSLFAYMVEPDGIPIIVERTDFHCDSQTGIPLTECHPEWGNQEKSRAIAQKIEEILDRYQPESWGLASPPELSESILDQIRHCHEKKLSSCVKKDVEDIHVDNVSLVFREKSHPYPAYNLQD